MHAFTGCDTVSALAGHGKMGVLKMLKGNKADQDLFQALGSEWELTPELF
jgi:hypothetical protein